MIETSAQYWIEKLKLRRHPEGGYYRETYRAEFILEESALPGFLGRRPASTGIYFLLEAMDFSALHRLRSDEMWHFYAGSPLAVQMIDPAGDYSSVLLGKNPEAGELFQAVVKAGCWFGASLHHAAEFALVGCTVAPGFDYADFEMGKREKLARRFPQHRAVIETLTRS